MVQEIDLRTLALADLIRPGDTVMWGQAGAEPVELTRALMAQRHSVGAFRVFLGVSYSDTVKPEYGDCVSFCGYCGTGANRHLAKAGKLDILPCHYSQLPELMRNGRLKIDVLMLQLAPADQDGNYSLSVAHEYLIAALETARVVIAEVNDQAPWTYGERMVRESDLTCIVRTSRRLLELHQAAPGEAELAIGRHIAGLIEDGATLQFGLGAMPEAVLAQLGDRGDLGVHSGTIGDKVAELMRAGVITNARKTRDRGVTVAGVMMGSRRIYEFAHRNPAIAFRSTDYTIEVDLTGQINAETAGGVYVGAVGGAVDFLRGAQRSRGGLPIVALPSTAGAASRVVAKLNGPVSTPRCDAGIIVTEYGVADLRGLTLSERVSRMIAIAHPSFREPLQHEVRGLR